MKKETYIKLMDYLKSRKMLLSLISFLYTFLPIVVFVSYPLIIVIKWLEKGLTEDFLLTIIVPAVTLLGVYVMRKLINKPRPYEKFETDSLIAKNKKGQSFPSNHAACGFVIAMTAASLNIWLFSALILIAFIIALTRIFAGVHFIVDVLAGVFIGLLMGSIFLFI